jgi:predicted RNase H-like nuclease
LLFYGQDDSSDEPSEVVEPLPGRVVIFSSGAENTHRVERVTAGERFVLAFWFTCDVSREFEIFLDGSAHLEFSGKIRGQLERQQEQQRRQAAMREKQRADEETMQAGGRSTDQMMDL